MLHSRNFPLLLGDQGRIHSLDRRLIASDSFAIGLAAVEYRFANYGSVMKPGGSDADMHTEFDSGWYVSRFHHPSPFRVPTGAGLRWW
jgi:hypothetical protein